MVFQAPSKPVTLDEFIAYALLPENSERNFEFIDGALEVSVVAGLKIEVAKLFR